MDKETKIAKLLEIAEAQIGKPYKYGAYLDENDENQTAFDCSSFIQFIFDKIGVKLPRSSVLQAATEGKEINFKDIQAGDLVFFEGNKGHYNHNLFNGRKIYVGHVALYAGENEIIHAVDNQKNSGVSKQTLASLSNPPYNIITIKRFIF